MSRDSVCPLKAKVTEYGDNLVSPCQNVFQSTRLKQRVKIPQSLPVRSGLCVSVAGVRQLHFLKMTLNFAIYQNVLDHFLIFYIEDKFEDGDFVFQKDLASTHPAKSNIKRFKKNDIQVLDWPANSPDARPIKKLSGIIKRKLRKFFLTNLQELQVTIL